MYKAQVKEYKHAILNLDEGLADCKAKFLKMYQKRARQEQNQTASQTTTSMKYEEDHDASTGVHFNEGIDVFQRSDQYEDGEDDGLGEEEDDYKNDTGGESSFLGGELAVAMQ